MDQNQPNPHYPQPVPQQVQPAPTPQQPTTPAAPQSRSAMAIVGLVLGIIAICISFVPIVNNFAALLAVVGLIFAIIGVVQTSKGSRSGKGMSIAALILNILAFVIVLATQALFSAAFDAALSSDSPSRTTTQSSASADSNAPTASSASQSSTVEESFENLPLGTAVELNNGLTVSVDAVQTGLKNYDGSPITGITVTYVNNSSSSQSFALYEWKGEDAQGAQRDATYYSEATDELDSGSLAAGGTVTGSIYFDGAPTKVVYEQLISFDDTVISWTLA